MAPAHMHSRKDSWRVSKTFVKHATIIALAVQNATVVCLLRYSRIMPLVSGHRYYASTAVFVTEVIKFTFFLSVALYEIAKSPQTPDSSTVSELSNAVTKAMFTGDSWKLAVPAMLYALQNNLQYLAASNLDAPTIASTYQLKLFTTAVFGVLLMNRSIGLRKSLGLVAILVGIVPVYLSLDVTPAQITSIQELKGDNTPRSLWELRDMVDVAAGRVLKRSATYEGIELDLAAAHPRSNAVVGFIAAITACLLSGFAGVYVEKLHRARGDSKTSIWVRNVQMSFYSLWPTLFLGVLFLDGEYIAKAGFFTGYNWVVWLLIATQALGGILVALCLDRTDNFTKCYATSISTILVLIGSMSFPERPVSLLYVLGTVIILAAVFVYRSSNDENKLRAPPINISQYDKAADAGYFDLDVDTTPVKGSLRDRDPTREALSTSRPTTPVSERRHVRPRN